MKNSILLLLFALSFQSFSKGKLLFSSNIQGSLKINGIAKNITKANEYYTFSLISGAHAIEFIYQNQRVLDTIIQIIDNNQSIIKLEFATPKNTQIIQKEIPLPQNQATTIIYSDTLNKQGLAQSWYVFNTYSSSTDLVNANKQGYYSQQFLSCDSGTTLKIDTKKSINKLSQIINQIDDAVFNNSGAFLTYVEIIDLDSKALLHKLVLPLDKATSFEFLVSKNSTLIIKTTSFEYKDRIDYTISSDKQSNKIANAPIAVREENDFFIAQKIETIPTKKDVFSFELPENTKSWNYYTSTENNLTLDELLKRISSNQTEATVDETYAFESYYNQRYINGTGAITYVNKRSNMMINNNFLNPIKPQMSVGILYNKPKEKIAAHYVYIVVKKEVIKGN